jgi:adenine-specific DNA-methyltransferase
MEDINETPGSTPNFRTELAEKLAELVPEAIADGKVDVVKLKELLQEDAGDDTERFGLFWPGKRRAIRAAQEPTTATLRPDKENSKDWDTTQNVFIEGDNLEVLKILQKHYHNKIKLIYIDPPYNTGKDFVYPDNYKEGLDSYLEWTRQVNEDGKRVSTNSESEGRYHSNWINMMYPRLKLARNLLTDDGVIFISIDDNEHDNLRKVCNEIFGEHCFVASMVWKSRQNKDNRNITGVSVDHEYVLCYSRLAYVRALKGEARKVEQYSNPDKDPRGPWTSGNMVGLLPEQLRPNCHYDLVNPATGLNYGKPEMGWRYERATMDRLIADGRILWPENPTGRPRKKVFLDELDNDLPGFSSIIGAEIYTRNGTAEVSELFSGHRVFDFPKPTALLEQLIEQVTSNDDIVLDFFAGSASLAQAVMQANSKDGSHRRFVLVQLPEPTPERSTARQLGFKLISRVSRERIRLSGEKLQVKARLSAKNLDVGFRSFVLADTCFAKWQVSSQSDRNNLEQHLFQLRETASNIATQDELLTEILLKQGYSLTEKIAESKISGLEVRVIGENMVLAYLTEAVKPTLEQLRALVDQDPQRIIVLEDAFQGDDELKTNLAQLCKSKGIELWTA